MKPSCASALLHVGGRPRAGLVVVALRVGNGREHRAGRGQLVVVGRGVREEPVVVPLDLGRDLLVRGRRHARVVHGRGEAARAVGGVVDMLERRGRVDRAHPATLHREAPGYHAVQARRRRGDDREHDENGELALAVTARDLEAHAALGRQALIALTDAYLVRVTLGIAQGDSRGFRGFVSQNGSRDDTHAGARAHPLIWWENS